MTARSICSARVARFGSLALGHDTLQGVDRPTTQLSQPGSRSLLVRPSDIIDAGKVAGQMGTAGNWIGIHIRFEMRRCNAQGQCRIQNPSCMILPGLGHAGG